MNTPERRDGEVVVHLDVAELADYIVDRVLHALPDISSASPWLDVQAASVYLACSPERVRKLVQERRIPFHQEGPGSRLFFNRRELDAWLLGL